MNLTKTDLAKYSLGKTMRYLCEGKENQAYFYERDISHSMAVENKRIGVESSGFMIPGAVLHRDLGPDRGSTGGYLIGQEVGTFVDALRPASVVLSLGADVATGLKADMTEPVQSSTSAAQWLSSSAPGTRSNLTFGAVNMVPHRLVTQLFYGRQLLIQSDQRIASIVANDLRRVFGTAIDQAALTGTGIGPVPLGITNTSGVQTITFGGSATQASLAAMEEAVANANGEGANSGWAASPLTRQKLRSLPENGTGSQLVWRNGNVLDHTAKVTSNLSTTNQLIYSGDWSNLLVGFWGSEGVEILTDPYTASTAGQIIVTAFMLADVGIKQLKAFVYSNDAANQ